MSDKSDRIAANQEYRGAKSGHQDSNVTGKPVKAPEKPSNLSGQVRHIVIEDAAQKWATDAGGLSTKFGKGGPGDSRGTSGKSNLNADEKGNIKHPVTPQGKKPADSESMSTR